MKTSGTYSQEALPEARNGSPFPPPFCLRTLLVVYGRMFALVRVGSFGGAFFSPPAVSCFFPLSFRQDTLCLRWWQQTQAEEATCREKKLTEKIPMCVGEKKWYPEISKIIRNRKLLQDVQYIPIRVLEC